MNNSDRHDWKFKIFFSHSVIYECKNCGVYKMIKNITNNYAENGTYHLPIDIIVIKEQATCWQTYSDIFDCNTVLINSVIK